MFSVASLGIAILTKSYLSDFCAVQPRFLGRFMYGSQVAGFLVGTVDETLALMAKAQLDSPLNDMSMNRVLTCFNLNLLYNLCLLSIYIIYICLIYFIQSILDL